MTTKVDVVRQLRIAREYLNRGDYDAAENGIKSISKCIFILNFYSVMGEFYEIKSIIDEHKKNYESMIFDQLICLSPRLDYQKREEVEKKLLNNSKNNKIGGQNGISFTIPKELMHLIPFSVSFRYKKSTLTSGSVAEFSLHVKSYFTSPVDVDSIDIVFSHNNNEEITTKISKFTINPNTLKVIHSSVQIPDAVRTQTVKSIAVHIGNIVIGIDSMINEQLTVVPDTSCCEIEVDMPPRCLICVKLPVTIRIKSTKETLKNLQLSFQHDGQFPPEYQGDFGPFTIQKGETKVTKFTFRTSTPVFTKVTLSVSFITKTSGLTSIEKSLYFPFASPFSVNAHVLDSNFEEIHSSSISAVEEYKLEANLLNVLDCPITLERIALKREDYDDREVIDKEYLPVVINQGEQYTFFADQKPGIYSLSIHFKLEQDEIHYLLKMHRLTAATCYAKYEFVYPPLVSALEPMNCMLIIDRTNIDGPEALTVKIEVEEKKQFFENGPRSMTMNVWGHKLTKIPIEFIPVEAGCFVLPEISINDGSGLMRTFHKPVVVRY